RTQDLDLGNGTRARVHQILKPGGKAQRIGPFLKLNQGVGLIGRRRDSYVKGAPGQCKNNKDNEPKLAGPKAKSELAEIDFVVYLRSGDAGIEFASASIEHCAPTFLPTPAPPRACARK